MHLLAQVANRLRTRASYIALVLLHSALEVARPFGRQDKEREEVGYIGGKCFFADVRLRTTSRRFFGASVVNVAMHIAILLILRAHFGCDGHSALAARHKAAKYLRLGGGGLRMAALKHDLLRLVEQALVHDGRMPPFVQFAAIEKMAVVERIGEDKAHTVVVYAVAVQTPHAVVVEELPDVLKPRIALRVQLKRRADYFGLLAVKDDGLGARVVAIPRRSRAGKIAAPRFGTKPARRVHTKVAYVLICHAELDRHEHHIVGGIVRAVVCLDMRDSTVLE